MPKVSIIIPNYNHAKFLQQRLDSVFNQTFQDFEVILLDDASTDGSQDLLKKYESHPKVSHIIFNETNSGSPFKQWQKGIELARGDYIWIAESDDYSELNFLEQLLSEESIDVVYAQTQDVNKKGDFFGSRIEYTSNFNPNIWKGKFSYNGEEFVKAFLSVKNVIPNASAVLFRKSLVYSDLFSSDILNMSMCGDWLFWIKLVYSNNVKFDSEHLNYFRQHSAVSRMHDTKDKIKKRLIEGQTIRVFLLSKWSVFEKDSTKLMYQKWFNLFTKNAIFKKEFYNICLPNISKVKFALSFIQYKLKN